MQCRRLRGLVASARLLGQQQRHARVDPTEVDDHLRGAERELDAHRAAPPGTVFVEFVPGPPGGMIVLDEQGRVTHFGPASGAIA